MADQPDLQELRATIDALDDKIFALLLQRAEIVQAVAPLKPKGRPHIRPGREAMMLRRLLAKPRGQLHPALIYTIWRQMIGCFTFQEEPFTIAVPASLHEQARLNFGPLAPLHHVSDARALLAAGPRAEWSFALLPLPIDSHDWWLALPQQPNLKIFMRLPLVEGLGLPAMVVGPLAADPTPADYSLFILALSAAEGQKLNHSQGWHPYELLAKATEGEKVFYLLAVAGQPAGQTPPPALAAIAQGWWPVGQYAGPAPAP